MQEYNYSRDAYTELVTEQIRCRKARLLVAEEILAHIDDQTDAYVAQGMDRSEAEAEAVRQMGDPVAVGNDMDCIHRPRMNVKLLLMTAALMCMGLAVQFVLSDSGEADWFLRQVICTEIAIAVMFAVCFIDYTFFGKYIWGLWGLWLAIVLLGTGTPLFSQVNGLSFFTQVNGQFQIYSLLMCAVPLYAGLLYRFRRSGYAGLFFCGAAAALHMSFCFIMPSRTAMTELFLIQAAMLTWAVHKGWFAVPKRNAYLMIYVPIGAVCVFVWAKLSYLASVGGYAFARMEAAFYPEKYADTHGYVGLLLKEKLKGLRLMGCAAEKPGGDWAFGMPEVASDMMFSYVLEQFGILAGVLLLVVLGSLIIKIFSGAFHQRNQLGSMIGFGCAGLFLTQTACYVLYNLGCTLFSPMYLPFLSRTGSGIVFSGFLIGLILSVYRNEKVVKEEQKAMPRYRIRIEKIIE